MALPVVRSNSRNGSDSSPIVQSAISPQFLAHQLLLVMIDWYKNDSSNWIGLENETALGFNNYSNPSDDMITAIDDGSFLESSPSPIDLLDGGNLTMMAPSITLTVSSISMVIACFLLIVVTIGGNTLVILAFHIEPSLQVLTNHWIVSLALTDIMLAAVVMPLQISRELFDGRWVFGALACDLFISLDVLCCTCSIYHLCLISLDRYFCVRYPISYPRVRTPQATLAAICATWMWCIAISFPRLLGWKDEREDEYACHMTNVSYMIFSSLVSFYIPLFLICIMYYGIYRVTKAQARKFCFSSSYHVSSRHCLVPEPNAEGFVSSALIATTLDTAISVARPSEDSKSSDPDPMVEMGGGGGVADGTPADPNGTTTGVKSNDQSQPNASSVLNRNRATNQSRFKFLNYIHQRLTMSGSDFSVEGLLPRGQLQPSIQQQRQTALFAREKSKDSLKNGYQQPTGTVATDIELRTPPATPGSKAILTVTNYLSDIHGRKERMQKARLTRKRQKQENRAAKVVMIVLAAFVLLWAPFFLVNVVAPLCGERCTIGEDVWKFVTWLGYCNSSINPFIYTCFNRTFRRAFASVFKSCCSCCGSTNARRRPPSTIAN